MIANADITIYNRVYDKEAKQDRWYRTIIRGVHVYVNHKTAVSDNGLNSAEVYKIRIPIDVGNVNAYLPPEEYVLDPERNWTIQNDDHVVIGECHTEIERPADLKTVFKKHCKITSWSDNRFGTLPHWRIGGE